MIATFCSVDPVSEYVLPPYVALRFDARPAIFVLAFAFGFRPGLMLLLPASPAAHCPPMPLWRILGFLQNAPERLVSGTVNYFVVAGGGDSGGGGGSTDRSLSKSWRIYAIRLIILRSACVSLVVFFWFLMPTFTHPGVAAHRKAHASTVVLEYVAVRRP